MAEIPEPSSASPRIALLTTESLASAVAVRRFVAAGAARIGLVALSDPFRRQRGGLFGQTARLIGRSGPGLLPYLAANFLAPRIAAALRGESMTDPDHVPLRLSAPRLGITLMKAADMNGEAFHASLRAHRIDLLVTFHCDQILSARTLASVPLGGINVHAGLLPDHRGPTPTIHALLEPEPRFGFTIHRMTPRIDSGEVLARETVALAGQVTALAAASAVHEAAVTPLLRLLDNIAHVNARPAQDGPYPGFPTRADFARLRSLGRQAANLGDFRRAWSLSV